MQKRLIIFLSVFYLAVGLNLPPEFKRCKRVGINECLKGAIQDALPRLEKGLPEFNFQPLQPLNIPSITVGEGKSAVNVVQNFNNINIYNIPSSTINKAEVEFSGTTFTITIESLIKEIRIEAEYNFNGKILLLPIVGNGNAFVKMINVVTTITLHGEEIQKKGTTYGDIKKVNLNFAPEKIEFRLDNLFGGNERLANEMNQVLNDNWKEVWEDTREGYEEALSLIFQDITNKIMKKVPFQNLIMN
ncbi:hypothetical protein ILUMI_24720 [Ignelater luminosus]|uniref:Uncharacterized protein n=1 Tax=Ignelater luminosus TaxID=2038154 RepID=A0A8K0C8K0_IGNLU|nr:hypothetical protein ILUMI_24720 [Ignelater luminosus]